MRPTPLLATVRKALRDLGRASAGETILVGLSGGADSVALLDALVGIGAAEGFAVVAAHLDHGLRPGSAGDARFCAELCERLGVRLRTARADVAERARRDRAGIEDAARRERYAFLRAAMREEGAAAIAVAHTRDDQAETFLLRLLRGAGSAGLAGMRSRSGDVLRPLLGAPRARVLEHLERRGLPWREDPTNADPSFLRNRVRHELLPYLEARFNPAIREGLARAAALLADEAEVLGERGRELFGRVARQHSGGVVLSRAGLASAPRAVARIALREAIEQAGGLSGVSAVHVERILDLAATPSASGRRLPLPGGREAVMRFGEVHLVPRAPSAGPFAYPLPVPGRLELPGGVRLLARASPGPAVSDGTMAVVPVPEGGTLMVRTRRPGDRVRAQGRDVSLRRFLVDRRVPADLRGSLPLVASGHRILWVPGQPAEGRGPIAKGAGPPAPCAEARFVRLEVRPGAPGDAVLSAPEGALVE